MRCERECEEGNHSKKDFHGELPRTPDNHVECGGIVQRKGRAAAALKKPGALTVESAPGRIKKGETRRRQLLTGDCSQRRMRWNEDVPLVMVMGDLSQPKKPGPDESR